MYVGMLGLHVLSYLLGPLCAMWHISLLRGPCNVPCPGWSLQAQPRPGSFFHLVLYQLTCCNIVQGCPRSHVPIMAPLLMLLVGFLKTWSVHFHLLLARYFYHTVYLVDYTHSNKSSFFQFTGTRNCDGRSAYLIHNIEDWFSH